MKKIFGLLFFLISINSIAQPFKLRGLMNISTTTNTFTYTVGADYVMEKVGSTYNAIPQGSYAAYSGSNFATVIESAMSQLTSGGLVFIKAGLYDNLDTINIHNDNITIQGAGKYLTHLKLKASADVVTGPIGLIDCGGTDGFTIRDIEIDGNGANQTKIDNGSTTTAICHGVLARNVSAATNNLTVYDCYIHDFTCFGIWVGTSNDGLVQNNRVADNYWNNITLTSNANRIKVDNNFCEGCSDGSISISGTNNTCSNNYIGDIDQVLGSNNSRWGLASESQGTATNISFTNNKITGVNIRFGIRTAQGTNNCLISGNMIYDLGAANAVGVQIDDGSHNQITNNKISGINGQGIVLHSSDSCSVMGNDIGKISAWYGIGLESASMFNKIIGNTVLAKYGINIASGCNNNRIIGNHLQGTNTNQDFVDGGTGNVYRANYGGFGVKWLADDGKAIYQATNTAAGTTGAQTINKASGSVNFAAGATTLVVTNSLATTTSLIFIQMLGTDATATSARVTKASGSFTITLNAAATAETAVQFLVIN